MTTYLSHLLESFYDPKVQLLQENQNKYLAPPSLFIFSFQNEFIS